MYKVIGADNKEYGPITADELRRWIAEGRLNGQSLARLEASGEWKPMASFSDFMDALLAQARGAKPAGAVLPSSSTALWSAQILAGRPEIQIMRCFSRSWQLMTANFGLLFGATAVVWLLTLVCELIPLVGSLISLLLKGVFYGGLYLVFLNRIRGRPADIGQAFAGFGPGFAQLMLASAVSSLLIGLGFVCCVVPCIYLLVAWRFCVPLVADKGLEFWSAMELSRKMVTRVWFEIFGLLVLAFLPYLLVCLLAGLKLAMPILALIQEVLASNRPDPGRIAQTVIQVSASGLPLFLLTKLALLLNLPFALGALMYAYEDLFGARPAPTP